MRPNPALEREPEAPAPLAPSGTTELRMPGFLPALVSWPRAARWPQPLLMAAHGAGDSAESQCEFWRSLLGERGVVVCPRGRAIRHGRDDHGYYYPNHLELEREALSALSDLAQRYAELVHTQRIVYAGYSQGAQMGALMLLGRGDLAPRLLLIEGGSGDFTLARARRFAASGGERVAFVCGTPGCARNAERSAAQLEAVGVTATVRHHPRGGHTYIGPISDEVAAAFAELTADDARWTGR